MPKLVTVFKSAPRLLLPFARVGIERRRVEMLPRKINLQQRDAAVQELLRRPEAYLRLRGFVVAPAIENELVVRLCMQNLLQSSGLVAASLLK